MYNCFLCQMQGWIRAIWRFIYFVSVTSAVIIGFLWAVLRGQSRSSAGRVMRRKWFKHVPPMMGIRMEIYGEPHKGTCLWVGNHISYLDPIAVLLHVEANVVAKAEVLRWPLVGLGANLIGTIFVNREEKSSRLQTAEAIRKALVEGISILVYPEGTTTAGPGTLPFRPRAFEAAFQAGVPVQPVAIMYESPKVAFIGDQTFIPHFFTLFRMPYIRGRISFGPLMFGENTAITTRQWIEEIQEKHPIL